MDKKIDLLGKLFISYIVILAICFLIYSLIVLPANGAEKINAIIGLLGWSATIFAPIAALFLIDNWKIQIKHEKSIEGLIDLHSKIGAFHQNLISMKSQGIPNNLRTNYERLGREEFNKFVLKKYKEEKIRFKEYQNYYFGITTSVQQYSLISNLDVVDFEDMLNQYFKIYYLMPTLWIEYLDFLIQHKNNGIEINSLDNYEKFKIFEIQFGDSFDKEIQQDPNNQSNFIFLSNYYLKELRDNSFNNIKKHRSIIDSLS